MLVAHAGGAASAGGDVLAGIDVAVAGGAAMVELDVRRTRDRVLVVHHGGPPGEETFAARDFSELGSSAPRLDDVLAHVAGRAAVDLELKEAGYESDLVRIALEHVDRERLVVSSFLDAAVRAVRDTAPEIATGLIVGRRPSLARIGGTIADAFPFRRLAAAGADFLAPSRALDVVRLRGRAASRGIPVLLWTVNDPAKLDEALADRRLLGVVTDAVGLRR